MEYESTIQDLPTLQSDLENALFYNCASMATARSNDDRNRILNRMIPLTLAAACCKKLDEIRTMKNRLINQIAAGVRETMSMYDDAQVLLALNRTMTDFAIGIKSVEVRCQESLLPGEYILTLRHASISLKCIGSILNNMVQSWICDKRSMPINPLSDVEVTLEPFPRVEGDGYHEAKSPKFCYPVRVLFEEPTIFECNPVTIRLESSWKFKCVPPPVKPEAQEVIDRFERVFEPKLC